MRTPVIITSEIRAALKQIKHHKTQGEDKITSRMLKMGRTTIEESMGALLNKCLLEGQIPKAWKK